MSDVIQMLKSSELIDKLTEMDKKKKELDTTIKVYQAELQKRGLRILEDKNLKQTKMYGSENNYVDFTYAQKLQIINYYEMKEIGGNIFDDNVKRVVDIDYTIEKKFAEILKAIFTEDYTTEMTAKDILEKCFELDSKQKNLLLKKLKGDYKKDKENIASVLNKNINELEIEEELDYIHKAIMWEKIKQYYPDNTEKIIKRLKSYMIVESTPKLGLKYEE